MTNGIFRHRWFIPHNTKCEVEIVQDSENRVMSINHYLPDTNTLHGQQIYLHTNARLACSATYVNGQLDGALIKWNDKGNRVLEEMYVKGLPKISMERNADGVLLHEVLYDDEGRIHKVERYWYDNGEKKSEVPYVHGLRQGVAQFWDINGQLIEKRSYSLDVRHGPYCLYYPSGAKREQGTFSDGLPCGKRQLFYDNPNNNQVKDEVFFNTFGQIVGVEKVWRPTGELSLVIPHRNGKRDGVGRLWTADGKKLYVLYVNGTVQNSFGDGVNSYRLYHQMKMGKMQLSHKQYAKVCKRIGLNPNRAFAGRQKEE